MLHTLNDLNGFAIQATDGNIGTVKDLYFDDRRWVVRHLVVETGSWLESHKVLLSPVVIQHVNSEDKTLLVSLSMNEGKESPHIDTQQPVSQQYEIDYLSYYGYAFYNANASLWDSQASSEMVAQGATGVVSPAEKNSHAAENFAAIDRVRRKHGDRHLRSCNETIGYHIQALDGEIGHLQGMLVDEDTWAIRYFIVNTSNWWLGHQVLVAPPWIKDINWGDAKIYVDMTQQQIQEAPLFNPEITFSREKEKGIHLHYGRDGYWEGDVKTKQL